MFIIKLLFGPFSSDKSNKSEEKSPSDFADKLNPCLVQPSPKKLGLL